MIIRKIIASYYLSAGLALEMDWLKRSYSRFIIVTSGRTGSTMLLDCLNQNPHIQVHYEVFHDESEKSSPMWHYVLHNLPIQYIQLRVFGYYPKAVESVGFKIHYYHCRQGAQKQVWKYLGKITSIKVIHLTRNILESYVSGQLARKYNSWHVHQASDLEYIKTASIFVEPHDCIEYFKYVSGQMKFFRDFFAMHDFLEVRYEDLVTNFRTQTELIQNWIGVQPFESHPRTLKQINRPISEIIENYSQLKNYFKDTVWENYFENQE